MWDVLLDAVIDSLKILPFLFVVYLIIELIEEKSGNGFKNSRLLSGNGAPLLGASAGLIPQCGFSVMATHLFSSGHIGAGTLIAVYIATSDEALPIMLADVTKLPSVFLTKMLPLFAIKFALALIVGYAVHFAAKGLKTRQTKTTAATKTANKDYAADSDQKEPDIGCCGHKIASDDKRESKWKKYLLHPILHSLKIFAYILLINIIFGAVFYYVGDKALTDALTNVGYFQPLLAALVGMIPNCASSVLLTQLFLKGAITLGSTVAGLSVNAGLAFAVLFKQNKNLKQNFAILGVTFAASALAGTILMLAGVNF